MDIHTLALALMAVQGGLGAFDTLYHHEFTEGLAQRADARRELGLHALRALLYGVLFIGLSSWAWQGAWAWLLLALFGVEIGLTLVDFVTEDRTRLLPASERVTHTVLAINGGAFVMLLVLVASDWQAAPTALAWQPQGLLGAFLALCGLGVAASGVRDGLAWRALGRRAAREATRGPLHFDDTARHVLVTGGTGFIGQSLVRALLVDGHAVTVLTRDPRRAAWQFEGRARCVARLEDLPACDRVDVVINLAGERILGPRWSPRRQAELRGSRLATTRRLVDWMAGARHRPALLLSASAIGYYGVQRDGDDGLLEESAPPQPIFMSTLCQDWETEARRAETLGVRVACLRFGLVLGHGGALPGLLLPVLLGLGGRLGSGRQWLSWIHLRDLLRSIAHAWQLQLRDASAVPVFNVVAPEAVTQAEFSSVAATLLRRPCRLSTPAAPLRLLLGEQATLLLDGQRVAPLALLGSGFRFEFPTLAEALADLCQRDAPAAATARARPAPCR